MLDGLLVIAAVAVICFGLVRARIGAVRAFFLKYSPDEVESFLNGYEKEDFSVRVKKTSGETLLVCTLPLGRRSEVRMELSPEKAGTIVTVRPKFILDDGKGTGSKCFSKLCALMEELEKE